MKTWLLVLSLFVGSTLYSQSNRLIAHRGGVVDESSPENSLPALQKAIEQHYWMVEIDLRLTADSVLITQHDRNFNRYFGVDSLVTAMNWSAVQKLRSNAGTRVLQFEEVLQQCQQKIHVMIDNKIQGFNESLFQRVLSLLDKYQLRESALMIGTDESTEFFRGKIKLSCTRKQLEEYQQRPDFNPAHYYLFSSQISKEDVTWAEKQGILVVGVLNHRNPNLAEAKEKMKLQAAELIRSGVRIFQLDSAFKDFVN
ncbi:glycerophosphodiester phosphodiesterase family protein [Flavihumibacter sp. RY-1]|uniref:Glycerophosphodiester phosphodiesterase family protein n=1 Tax=Flavihumibacter fluminis TaxID=2909236 RepID=A0ABS9BL69_9BACT|nr:glycerophosphodiester phosphodiesterase family protein [Flavihumibacter fluminis]MCF1715852.1 glycerophosphodiester phosphodiesterase family protein [Flavihumibacter fluminis]